MFNLLTWRSRLSRTLVGREDPSARLLAWARDDPQSIAIRLLTGPGGSGKSRLAAEVMDVLRGQGWSTGLIALDRTTTLPHTKSGLFVTVDYPEASREAVRALLRGVGRLESSPGRIRILLVSRQPMSWWQDDIIAARTSELCDAQEVALEPLTADLVCELVRQVADRLAALRGVPALVLNDAVIAGWHARNPNLHGLPLFATAAAVHAALGPQPAFSLSGPGIVEALTARERMRLDATTRDAGWPAAEAGSRLHALATLRIGLDERALRHLALVAPDVGLPDPERVVDEVRALGWWSDDQVCAPQPDLVAAELLHQVLVARPQVAPAWLAATLADPEVVEVERLSRLMHDLVTLRPNELHPIAGWLAKAVHLFPERARTWQMILESRSSSFWLSPVAATIGRALLEEPGLEDSERASILNSLSVRLNEAGYGAEALAVAREAVDVYRRLARVDLCSFGTGLAISLANLSSRLSTANDNAAALAAVQEAVEIHRRLARENPDTSDEPARAQGLTLLSNRLIKAGDGAAALEASREAMDIFRRHALMDPGRFEPDLAASLINLSICLSDSGDEAAALVAIKEATDVHRRLVRATPARFEPDMAVSLINMGSRLERAGERAAALEAIWEAVGILRRLAAVHPIGFEPDLALSLYNLSSLLIKAEDAAAALATVQEAADVLRRLARADPVRFEPLLASTLHEACVLLDRAKDAAALAATREAADVHLRLVRANLASPSPDMAVRLYNLSVLLRRNGDRSVAVAAAQEAVAVYRRMAHACPALFEPDLSLSLYNLFDCQRDAADVAGALAAIREAVEVDHRLVRENPARFGRILARSQDALTACLVDIGDEAAAQQARQEADYILRRQ